MSSIDDEPVPRAPHSEHSGYTGWLVLSYTLAPATFLFGVLDVADVDPSADVTYGLMFGTLGLLASPSFTHLVAGHGERSVQALLGAPTAALGGAVLGAVVGLGIGALMLSGDVDEDDSLLLIAGVFGAGIGAGAGWATWATYDIISTKASDDRPAAQKSFSMQLNVVPTRHGALALMHGTF